MTPETSSGSFRDPNGFVFERDGVIYRQVNEGGRDDYERLMQSGLYERLVSSSLLIPHEEVDISLRRDDRAYKVLRPSRVEYISYPYEWCFSQLKRAAQATLDVQTIALEYGMHLKDASAFNVQFRGVQPIFIDTLSFAKYEEGAPWIAYRQFCQHFVAPLALMRYRDPRLVQLFAANIDGIPLDLAASLLPSRCWAKFTLLVHILLHARSQLRYGDSTLDGRKGSRSRRISKLGLQGLIDNLKTTVGKLDSTIPESEWADYYSATNYDTEALEHKSKLVAEFLSSISPRPARIFDLGANTGRFSRIAADHSSLVVSQDLDYGAVEKNFIACVQAGEARVLPLRIDLTNPTPGIGWGGRERMSLFDRAGDDTVLALALIHHLAISNNVPLRSIAELLARLCRHLIIEFVPKEDSQVQRLLATREDIFPEYTPHDFERAFGEVFELRRQQKIVNSSRTLYLMQRR